MKSISLWAVTSNTDLTEGRGRKFDVGYFLTQEQAVATVMDKRYSKFCCMGVQSVKDKDYMVEQRNFVVYDDPKDFFTEHDTVARIEQIRNKLGQRDMDFLHKYFTGQA